MEEVKTGDGLRKSTQASGLEVVMRTNKFVQWPNQKSSNCYQSLEAGLLRVTKNKNQGVTLEVGAKVW